MTERWIEKYRLAWCVLAGLLLVVSFAPFSCATAGWIALVPAWWALTRIEKVRRQPFRHGYLVGLIYFGGVFWWICNVTPIGAFFLVLYMALYPAMWFMLVARLLLPREGRGGLPVLVQALAAAALWTTLEWWRSWFLTGFAWNELGISQAPSIVFRQLAAYGGVPLISFLLVTVNILWAEGLPAMAKTLREKRVVRPSLPFGAALLIVAVAFAVGWRHLQRHAGEALGPGLSYACVQPNIPQIPYDGGPAEVFEQREDRALDDTVKLTTKAIAAKPHLLIWPEATIDQGVFNDRPMNEAVRDICAAFNGYFLLGSQDFQLKTRKLYNCAYFFSPGGDMYDYYYKNRLVILGEFLPFGNEFPWLRKAVGMGMDFTPGPGPKRFEMKDPAMTFSPLICFEDTLPEVADSAARLKSDFFITITNDGWYQGWCAAWGIRQHLNHAVFRCVEQDRPMIRCSNNGISCEIDQDGTVVSRFHSPDGGIIDVGGIFTGTLRFHPFHPTIYQQWGDWIVLISCGLTGMLGLRFFLSPFLFRE